MTSMLRFAAAILLLSLPMPGPTMAAGTAAAPTLNVDALYRGHSPADEPAVMDVRINWAESGLDVLATVEDLREAEGEYEGQPARVWTATLRMSAPGGEVPDMTAQVREYIGLDGRHLGSTILDARQRTVETIHVRTHPLPTAARPGEEGLMYEGSETTRDPDGNITAQFFEKRWRVPPAGEGETRLQVIRNETDSSGNVTNEFVSNYAVTPEGKLRLLSSRSLDLGPTRQEMLFTPR